MTITFYYMSESPPCRAVELTADKVGVKLNRKVVDVTKGEQLSEDFIKINPLHCIPTIVDDNFAMWESRAIMCYLVNKYSPKDDTLYPKDPKKRALVDQMLNFDMGTLYKSQSELLYGLLGGGKELDPAKERKFKDALKYLNSVVSSHQFITGTSLTIADIAILASLSFSESCDYDISEFKAIISYKNRVKKALPNYDKVSKDGIERVREYIKSKAAA